MMMEYKGVIKMAEQSFKIYKDTAERLEKMHRILLI